MKRIIFGLMLAMMFCTLVQGANSKSGKTRRAA